MQLRNHRHRWGDRVGQGGATALSALFRTQHNAPPPLLERQIKALPWLQLQQLSPTHSPACAMVIITGDNKKNVFYKSKQRQFKSIFHSFFFFFFFLNFKFQTEPSAPTFPVSQWERNSVWLDGNWRRTKVKVF